MSDPATTVEAFELTDYWGEIAVGGHPSGLEVMVHRLVDASRAEETLHWSRSYLYATSVETDSGPIEVAVKQFRNQGLRRRLERRLKGSKALRSWRAARALQAAGIPTPEPLALIESRRPDGPSFFVTRRLRDFIEVRYYFRALEASTEKRDFPAIDADRFIRELAGAIRRLHDAGIWHRDLSVGNLLLRTRGEPDGAWQIYFVDLNRARLDRRLTFSRRTRDLSRLRVFRPVHRALLLRCYWRDHPITPGKRFLYQLYARGFLLKIRAKGALRHPIRWLRDLLLPRRPHVHIPAAPERAPRRDRAVWDALSDQPHQHATRWQRTSVRLVDSPRHLRELRTTLAVLPRAWRRYGELKRELYGRPQVWQGMGVAVRPLPGNPEAVVEALEKLGCRRVLLRLHPWQQDHGDEEELAEELARRGIELAFALPQNRELVRESARWHAAVKELAERFIRFGRHFQVGQAVNRSKWGVWNYSEYLELVASAAAVLRSHAAVEVLGPAVIDYELHRTAALLNIPWPGVYFDIVASLLYVDRRGAPESRQLGFDTVDKVVQLKALAESSTGCGNRSWITEFNWPLREGPHAPAGRKVAVSEETQADYLVRYYLLALGTGMVERVYWWQLIARGYGLCHLEGHGELRLRPGFQAFATLHRVLEGSLFLGPLPTPDPGRLYAFRSAAGEEIMVAWSATDSPTKARLPRPAERAMRRDGEESAAPTGVDVEIDGSPRYYWLRSS